MNNENESSVCELVRKKKEIHVIFIITSQTDKVLATVWQMFL